MITVTWYGLSKVNPTYWFNDGTFKDEKVLKTFLRIACSQRLTVNSPISIYFRVGAFLNNILIEINKDENIKLRDERKNYIRID